MKGAWRPLSCALLGLLVACAPALPDAIEPTTTEATAVARSVGATLTAHPTATVPTSTATPPPTPSPTPSPVPSATPTVRPSPSPTVGLESTPPRPTKPPAASPQPTVAVWEQDITLSTYGWQEALVPTEPDDPIYPYPRLDFEAATAPTPRAYRAVVIQNAYVQLIVVPELGGRILRWTDRTTGQQLFYANPVVKPTRWGYRGWWLATGGMEWAFPTEEHGLNEYRPWQYQLLWNGVRVWDTEDRTGLTVEVTLRLDGEHNYFTLTPRITNPTAEPQYFQFWANAMLTLSERNTPSPI